MKIVLRQDVPKLGEAGTVQSVADGYARNYLIPKGLAVVATPGEIKTAEHNLKVRERKVARQEETLQSLADKIDGTRLEFTARAGDQGRLFGSITSNDVAEQLNAKIGEEIDRRKIQLSEPLRTVGDHTVEVHLVGRLRPTITVVIEAEGAARVTDEEVEAAGANLTEAAAVAAENLESAEDEASGADDEE